MPKEGLRRYNKIKFEQLVIFDWLITSFYAVIYQIQQFRLLCPCTSTFSSRGIYFLLLSMFGPLEFIFISFSQAVNLVLKLSCAYLEQMWFFEMFTLFQHHLLHCQGSFGFYLFRVLLEVVLIMLFTLILECILIG